MSLRGELTEKIARLKAIRALTWSGLAAHVPDLSKEFVTAGLLGQMALPKPAA